MQSVQSSLNTRMWASAQHDGHLPNTGGALCSTTPSLADTHYCSVVQERCQDAKRVENTRGAPNYQTDLSR